MLSNIGRRTNSVVQFVLKENKTQLINPKNKRFSIKKCGEDVQSKEKEGTIMSKDYRIINKNFTKSMNKKNTLIFSDT